MVVLNVVYDWLTGVNVVLLTEYTEMVDNLVKVFEKATEKYLDQISSSDEEIAVENHEEEVRSVKSTKKKSSESPPRSTKPSATAASRKRER